MKQEKSCGIIVVRDGLILLLHYPAGHWGCPKGHVEEREDEQATALRELEEETGISDIKFVPGFREKIGYVFKAGGIQRQKTVVFFLGRTNESNVTISHEHRGYDWVPFDDVPSRVTYDDEREVMVKALEHLSDHDSTLGKFF